MCRSCKEKGLSNPGPPVGLLWDTNIKVCHTYLQHVRQALVEDKKRAGQAIEAEIDDVYGRYDIKWRIKATGWKRKLQKLSSNKWQYLYGTESSHILINNKSVS